MRSRNLVIVACGAFAALLGACGTTSTPALTTDVAQDQAELPPFDPGEAGTDPAPDPASDPKADPAGDAEVQADADRDAEPDAEAGPDAEIPGTPCTGDGDCVAAWGEAPACREFVCEQAAGLCRERMLADGTPCSDGEPCTDQDSCQAGACVPGAEPACDDHDDCTSDACVKGTGCVSLPSDGNPCDDQNPCTTGDRCVTGTCTGAGVADCGDGNDCTFDSCDPAVGCVQTPTRLPCSDGDACTVDDVCDLGVCKPGTPRACEDWSPCTADSCDPATGCVFAPTADGAPCNDGNACTAGDLCAAGTCVGEGLVCDDANPCTDDGCDVVSAGCVHIPNTKPCDLGSACTKDDVCADGACTGGPGVDCDDRNPCTLDGCDAEKGCTHEPDSEGTCDDKNPCTSDDRCLAGLCVGGPPTDCDDANVCTTDSCSPMTGCVHLANELACEDGNLCTHGDRCAAGACVPGPMKVCGDENPCTDDGCDPKTGCTHVPNADPCSDGSVCTVGDTCSGGGCKPGPALDCDDHLACTTDSCHPVAGCGHVPVADGTGCVQAGCTDLVFAPAHTCVAGVCTSGGASRDCKDGNECTADYCLLPDGGCLNVVLEDGTACAPSSCNGLVWTRPSTCAAGTCTLRGIQNCDDALACTSDACDASAGCSHAVEAGKCLIAGTCYAEGASGGKCRECRPSSGNAGWTYVPGKTCDDGKACTRDDRCAAGGSGDGDCAGTAYSCDDGLACTKDVCDGLGGCPNTLLAGYCLIGGACYGSGQPNPQQPCQVCDPTKSGTAWTGKADGTRCIDGACNGLAYTAPTTCQAGLCVAGGGTSSCDDGHACTNDSCSVASGCANVLKAGHCLIPGQGCVANGAANPANPCQACNTSRSTTAWSSLADGSTCIAANCSSLLFTAARTCVAGQCTGGGASVNCDDERTCTNDTCSATTGCANALSAGNCLISGTCYAAGIPNPGNACQACTPATSTSTWSSVANGTSCGTGGQVCFSGACCTPQCAGYACGDDSCGGSCGTCQTGYSCVSHQCSQTSNKVLLLTDTASTNASLAAGLNAAGLVTTHVSGGITSYTGSPAASGFAVVILATGGSYSTDMSSAGQTSIATAAASGNTGVVFFEWSSYHTYNYRWQSLKNLLLLAWRSDSSGSTMTFTSTTSHPIWTGLPSSFTTVPSIYYSIGATIVNGGSSIATSTQAGGPAVIVRDTGGGRVVHFANATHNSAGTSVWGDANLMKLVSNAAKWAAKLL